MASSLTYNKEDSYEQSGKGLLNGLRNFLHNIIADAIMLKLPLFFGPYRLQQLEIGSN